MNERHTSTRALSRHAENHPSLLKAAERQLSIAVQLKQEIERRQLIAVLNRIDSNKAAHYLSKQELDESLIERFKSNWNWPALSQNRNLPWSLNLIERYEDAWDWGFLSGNAALPWSPELVERFANRWNPWILGKNEGISWLLHLSTPYHDEPYWLGVSLNEAISWSPDLILRKSDAWHWGDLSSNKPESVFSSARTRSASSSA